MCTIRMNFSVRLCVCFVMIFFQGIYAQEKRSLGLDTFSEVKVFDGISVTLVPDTENKAVITGIDAQDVTLVQSRGILKIRMSIQRIFSGHNTFVELHYVDPIDIIDVNERSFVGSDVVLKQVDLTIKAQEGGETDLKVDLNRLDVKAVTGGIVEVKGIATVQDIDINTGGNYDGMDAPGDQIEVRVSAGGSATVRGSKYVKADVRAGGTINVFGNPEVLEKGKFIGGTINEMEH